MRFHNAAFLVLVATVGMTVWHSQLFTVQRPGERPRALAALASERRRPVRFDVALPAVPVGMQRLCERDGVLIIHYWAPWEQDGLAQATLLDSLRRAPGLEGASIVLVCFDPFPSVARYVGRHRFRLGVLLDTGGELRASLPCPSLPYTYVVDRAGRIAVAQAGRVDWLAPGTLRALHELIVEPLQAGPPNPTSNMSSWNENALRTVRGEARVDWLALGTRLALRPCLRNDLKIDGPAPSGTTSS